MQPRTLRFMLPCLAVPALLLAQGLNTTATKDDWEEINFEFNSSVLSDGYPSLLRLAELLGKNADFKVTLEGNTDSIGSAQYNEKLSHARAETVQKFLVKYGANASQIRIVARGKGTPKVPNTTKEGRFVNRRVTMTVRDGTGKIVSAGGVGEAIQALQAQAQAQSRECCDEILKRLDKLDEILAAVNALKGENDRLKDEIAALQRAQAGLEKQVAGLPHPPEKAELQQMMASTAEQAIAKAKPSRFALLGLNIGPTLSRSPDDRIGAGNITFTGKARYFAPFGRTEMHALQAEGEYMYYRDRQEGQFDLGIVNRMKAFQLGLFSSIKHAGITDVGGGTLGQAALTGDWLFSRGRLGFFGTKGYLDNRVIAREPAANWLEVADFPTPGQTLPRAPITGNLMLETYLKIVDQIGASATIGAWKDAYIDANFGALFRRGGTNRPGGMFRLVQPINPQWAFTVEAGLNETMLGPKNSGRLVFGLQFGNWLKPKEYAAVKHPVPADVPRLRYEVLTRVVRTGNAPPVADAGPDLTAAAAGTVTLDGSGSFDPDGDPITYRWTQIGGPTVTLSATDAAKVTFTAAAGQTYNFRLTVRDSLGAQGTDNISVTTQQAAPLRVVSFVANPATITAGQSTRLTWNVEGADSVEISGIGPVTNGQGNLEVSPAETTTYTLTIHRGSEQAQATAIVTVNPAAQPFIASFFTVPDIIAVGESARITWDTRGATDVRIEGIGPVNPSGSQLVSPTVTTDYRIIATNGSAQATQTITLRVLPPVRITSFTVDRTTVRLGETVTFSWTTENADAVYLADGPVPFNGSKTITPLSPGLTTFVLRASGNRTTDSRQIEITVITQ